MIDKRSKLESHVLVLNDLIARAERDYETFTVSLLQPLLERAERELLDNIKENL